MFCRIASTYIKQTPLGFIEIGQSTSLSKVTIQAAYGAFAIIAQSKELLNDCYYHAMNSYKNPFYVSPP